MFTAMQSAHLARANSLVEARKLVSGSVSLICNTREDARAMRTIVDVIDEMLAVSVPSFAPGSES